MVIRGIVILSLLITQALCAPTGCIESCSSYTNQFHTQLSGTSNHGDILQGAAQLQGLDYSRPGTWTEHNDYNINNGKVHEEKGQIVDGHKTVRYFKKNYSSSFGTRYPSGSGISEVEQLSNNYRQGVHVPSSENVFNSHNQRTYNQVGSLGSIGQQQDYNRIQSQQHTQSAIRRTNTQSERLEDFGEHSGNSEVIQQSASGLNTQVSQQPSYTNTQSGNWSKVDSYKTNGGHGRVFEEEGQYTTGPKKVRYYKRNYTSSYSSSNGLPVPDIANIGLDNIHSNIENIHREIGVDRIHKEIGNLHRDIHKHSTVQGVSSSNTAQTNINSYGDLNTDSLYSNSDAYRRRPDYRNNLSSVHRNEQQHTSIASEYAPEQNPSQSTYGVSSYRTYGRREGHVNTLPTSQYINPTSGYTNVLSTGNNGYNRNMYNEENLQQQTDNLHQAEHLDEHQSTITQNHMDIDNLRQNMYNQHNVVKPVAHGRVFHKEQWSSSHRQETSLPTYTSDISQISGQNAQYNSQYRENSFNSAHQTKSGKLMVGAVDLTSVGNSDDCTQGTVEHGHVHSEYRRMYKRSTKDDKLSDQQQTEQSDDTTQQTEDLIQQTDNFDDIVQQTSGKLQSGQQSQQTYQPWKPGSGNQESKDLTQQTGDFDDLTQETSGKIEFGPQSQQSHQSWGPGSVNQHSEDFTQQTGDFDDLTQETSGKIEFGPQSQQSHQSWGAGGANQHSEDFTQQTGDFDDLTQETSGKIEFGQTSQQSHQPWSQHSEDLTQQTGDFDDLTQQTSGKLESGQQSYQPWGPESATQQTEDLTQQTDNFDDIVQQTSGKLQFGQQSYQPWGPERASQHSEDVTQQNEHVLPVSDINDNIPVDQVSHGPLPKPAGKPRPRPRYSRVGSVVGLSPGSNSGQGSNNIQSSHAVNEDKLLIEVLNHSSDKSADRVSGLPPVVVPGTEADGTRSQDLRGDQGVGSSTNNDKPSTQKTEGLQWHYTYHPSDQRPLVQQADKKDKGGMQQQSTIPDFSDSQDNLDQQQAQNKYIFEDLNQQSSSPGKTESGLHQQSQNGQEKDQLEVGQQTLGKSEDNPQHRLEPRILEAYGGGPYDALHDENIQ